MRGHLFDAVLFDIDNVLVDTRQSYLAAIRKTVEIYLNRPGVVSAKDVDQFKLLGGFNDDWDCCYGIITFLDTAIQGKPVRFGDHRRQRLFVSEIGEVFTERPLGIQGLLNHLRVLYERVELPSFQKIARIFQEVYLGKGGKGTGGFIQKEKPIFPKQILEKLHAQGIRFGIVTGRNKFEAEFALKRFGILKLFDAIVTIDDVKKEEKKTGKLLRKPSPWPLLECIKRLKTKDKRLKIEDRRQMTKDKKPKTGSRSLVSSLRSSSSSVSGLWSSSGLRSFLYVGDLPDDVLTAQRAKKFVNVKSAAFTKFATDQKAVLKELKKIKPDFYLKKPEDLLVILGGAKPASTCR